MDKQCLYRSWNNDYRIILKKREREEEEGEEAEKTFRARTILPHFSSNGRKLRNFETDFMMKKNKVYVI